MLVEACNSDPPKHQHQNLQNTAFTESPHPCLICRGSLAIDRHRNRPRTSTDYNGNYLYSIYIYIDFFLIVNKQYGVLPYIYIYTSNSSFSRAWQHRNTPQLRRLFSPFWTLSLSLGGLPGGIPTMVGRPAVVYKSD